MKKYPLIGISIIAVVLLVLISLTYVVDGQGVQLSNHKTISTNDEMILDIRAGVHNETNGNYGLGFVICISNPLDINITGTITIYWNFTKITVASAKNATFALSAHHPEVQIGEIDWLHFPFPVLKLQIIVTVNEISKSISRSGIEIGPFVFFPHHVKE